MIARYLVAPSARNLMDAWLPPLCLLLAICILWQVGMSNDVVSGMLLPRPTGVISYGVDNIAMLSAQTLFTAWQAAASLLLAAFLGITAGTLIFASSIARDTFYPIILVLQVLPKVAMAPLFVVWLGTGDTARIAFGAFLAFFPVLLATTTGLEQTPQYALRLCRSLLTTPAQTFCFVRVPYALLHIFSGLRIAATLAVTGVVIGEFMTASRGLGYVIIDASNRIDSKALFAALMMLCIVGLVLFGVVVLVQRAFKAWYFGQSNYAGGA